MIGYYDRQGRAIDYDRYIEHMSDDDYRRFARAVLDRFPSLLEADDE